jgi:hypothetical protein
MHDFDTVFSSDKRPHHIQERMHKEDIGTIAAKTS